MSEFTDELKNKIIVRQKELANKDEALKKLGAPSTYPELYDWARMNGEHLGTAITEATADLDGVYFGTAAELLEPLTRDMHRAISNNVSHIQQLKNDKSGMRIKAQVPEYNRFKAMDMAEDIVKARSFANASDHIVKYMVGVVDTAIQSNMSFSNSLGYDITVTRTYDGVGQHTNHKDGGEACMWCKSKEGTKNFANMVDCMNDDIWMRHDNCACQIDYENKETGTFTQNVRNYRRRS